MKFRFGCILAYEVARPSVLVLNIEAAFTAANADLSDILTVVPEGGTSTSHTDPVGANRYRRILAAPGPLSVRYAGEVDLRVYRADPASVSEIEIGDLPLDILPYLLPSRFVPSDRLQAFAVKQFGQLARGHQRVAAICNWINENLDYISGTSGPETHAGETLLRRAGVCRDFAHLGISFCRALGVPARFVSCYAFGLNPPDFHAVFEAYLSGRWWLFDATRQAALDGIVRIGVGRDAAEVAFATPYGEVIPGAVRVWIERSGGGEEGERTTEAISLDLS